ncbi:hypothetical protein [Maritimibacter sp. UBA3975]|uniref:hypothetical protein n=1 Tax=Maritimibacter sp. UBA3975 TaxID=1946833 RepID=UPI000C08F2DA|nr:hypothetical protein [Maritimibacter sp. UBA3975]MAM62842.1 hypothetical protein [Maritimibacter sp.]|tara:strand:- start:554 stop:1051 length:498 start_codon:yes stop_codon:yes gene_type:complete
MQDALVAAADDLVADGMRETGIPLTDTLRHYIAITLARYMREQVQVDGLTIRVVEAMDRRADTSELRALADTCLIACSVFERRLRRAGGSLRHYAGLGQTAYDAATLTEQAYSFPHMRDVIAAATGHPPEGVRDLLAAARAGSSHASERLSEDGVIAFPTQRFFH